MGIYDNIRNVAKNKGYSINRLEKELEFPRGSMYKYDQSTPSVDKLSKIAEFLGVSIDQLTTGTNSDGYYYSKETAELAQEVYQNKELHMLFNAVRDATPQQLKDFRDMILIMKRREENGSD